MNAFDLDGKTMVITGGTNGIGRGLVEYFAKQGVTVAAIGSRPSTAEKLKIDMAEKGLSVSAYNMNIRNVPEIRITVDRILQDLGHIDIMVSPGRCKAYAPKKIWSNHSDFLTVICSGKR